MEVLLIFIGIIILLIVKDGGFSRPKEYIKDFPAEDLENWPMVKPRCRPRKRWKRMLRSRFHGRRIVVS
jgi:hypothetical protein